MRLSRQTILFNRVRRAVRAWAKAHKEKQAIAKTMALLEYYIPQGKSAEQIAELTGINLLTVQRAMEVRR